VGTDHGTYLTLDGGKAWHLLAGNLPNVANYDMMVHPRDNELLIATHGRSVYVMDVKPLQASRTANAAPLVAFEPARWPTTKSGGEREYPSSPKRHPSVPIRLLLGQGGASPLRYKITDAAGKRSVPSPGSVKPALTWWPGT
jgi:hypothetical protein